MANLLMSRALWNKKNQHEQKIITLTPSYADILRKKRPELIKIVQPDYLWAHLRKYEVVNQEVENKIKLDATPEERVGRLLDHLDRGASWRLHAFLRACSLTKQEHVIDFLGMDKGRYEGLSPPDSDTEESTPSPLESKLSPHILTQGLTEHCTYCKDNIMHSRVFDFKHGDPEDDVYSIVKCYIKQVPHLTRYKSVAEPIEMEDILKPFGEYPLPKTILLSGHPGVGKSTFCKCFSHRCSKELLLHIDDKTGDVKCPDQMLAIYVPARSLTTDIWGSVEQALCCAPKMKKVLMEQIKIGKIKPNCKAALAFDGIDEVRNEEVLNALKEFTGKIHQDGGPQLLVSTRTGLSRMDKSLFDRFLSLEGFTIQQGVEYTHKYVTAYDPKTSGEKTEGGANKFQKGAELNPVLSYVDKHQARMEHILCNPLRTHLLSALAVEGLLELDNSNVLQTVELLKTLECFVIRRETDEDGVSEEERNQFYRLCLYGLLGKIQEFTYNDLQKFNVSKSAYICFFKGCSKMEKKARRMTYYSFEHEFLQEYFAARAIETLPEGIRVAILLYVSSKTILGNLQKLIFSMLGQYGTDKCVPLLVGMTHFIMLQNMIEVDPNPTNLDEAWDGGDGWRDIHSCLEEIQERIDFTLPTPTELLLPRNEEVALENEDEGEDEDADEDKVDDEAVMEIWELAGSTFARLTEVVKGGPPLDDEEYWQDSYFNVTTPLYSDPHSVIQAVILDLLIECPQGKLYDQIARETYHRMLIRRR